MNSLLQNFRLKLKKVGKTSRPFRYDLNQIPYDYTMEVMNWFNKLGLVDRVPEDLWAKFITLYKRQWPKPYQRKRNARSQSGCLRRHYTYKKKETKSKGERGRHTQLNAEFQRIARRDKAAFFKEKYKVEENNRMEKPGDLLKKTVTLSRQHFMQGWR